MKIVSIHNALASGEDLWLTERSDSSVLRNNDDFYMPTFSSNMQCTVGLAMFLASVGLASGNGFVAAVANGGYIWLFYALIIAIIPLLIVGIYARLRYKMDFFSIMGMLSGTMTNPIALNYANSLAGSDMPAISYATVYPLAMFLRVIIAQSMILMFL